MTWWELAMPTGFVPFWQATTCTVQVFPLVWIELLNTVVILQVSAAGTPCGALPFLLAYLKLVHSVALDVLIQLLQLLFVIL